MTHSAIVHELGGIVLDVRDLARMAAFWGAVLGQEPGQPRSGGGWLTVGILAGTAWLVLQQVSEPKTSKNRRHLDFLVADVDAAITRILALGGSQISARRVGGGVTMADPKGNEFCIGAFRRTKEGKRMPREGVL
jgi:predicted enzyme related to lactoylglutathione lyase